MSQSVTQQITCPNCGAVGEFTAWIAFEQDSDEPLGLLAEDKLASYACPSCEAAIEAQYSCMYHDAEHAASVFYAPDDQEAEAIGRLYRNGDAGLAVPPEFSAQNKRRIVRSHDELRDKIAIFSDGLDDEVVELLKVMTIQSTQIDFDCVGDEPVWYAGLGDDGDLSLVVEPHEAEGQRFGLSLPRALYDKVAEARKLAAGKGDGSDDGERVGDAEAASEGAGVGAGASEPSAGNASAFVIDRKWALAHFA